MRRLTRIALAVLIALVFSTPAWSQQNIQSLINGTPVGGTLYLSAVTYPVTATVVISHAITIIGMGYGTFITGDPGNAPLITVNGASGANLEGIRVQNTHVPLAGQNSYVNIWFD